MDTSITQAPDWAEITAALAAAFDPSDVDFLPLTTEIGSDGKGLVAAYIDARAVQERLDAVVPGAWLFDWEPLHVNTQGQVVTAKGTITIHGVSRSDIGDGTGNEASKSSVSDAEKRAGVQWGIGRYIYALPRLRAKVDTWTDKGGKVHISGVSAAAAAELRRGLPKPGKAAPTRVGPYQDETAVVQQETAIAASSGPEPAVATTSSAATTSTPPAPKASKQTAEGALQATWNALHARALKLGFSEAIWRAALEKYLIPHQMQAALDEYERKQQEPPHEPEDISEQMDAAMGMEALWGAAHMRALRLGMVKSDEDWAELRRELGGSYEDVVARIDAEERRDLHAATLGSASTRNGAH